MAGKTPWGSACSGFFAFSNPWWSSFGIGLLGTENMQFLKGPNTVGFFFLGRIYAAPFVVLIPGLRGQLPTSFPQEGNAKHTWSPLHFIQPSFSPTGRRALRSFELGVSLSLSIRWDRKKESPEVVHLEGDLNLSKFFALAFQTVLSHISSPQPPVPDTRTYTTHAPPHTTTLLKGSSAL